MFAPKILNRKQIPRNAHDKIIMRFTIGLYSTSLTQCPHVVYSLKPYSLSFASVNGPVFPSVSNPVRF